MEELTRDELILLANMYANAQVAVKDAKPAHELLLKLERIINGRSKENHQQDTAQVQTP